MRGARSVAARVLRPGAAVVLAVVVFASSLAAAVGAGIGSGSRALTSSGSSGVEALVASVGGLETLGTAVVGKSPYLAAWNVSSGKGGGDVYVTNVVSDNVSVVDGTSTVAAVNVSSSGLLPLDPIDDPANPSVFVTFTSYLAHGLSHNVSLLHGPVSGGTQAVSNVTGILASDEPSLGVYDLSTGYVYLSDDGTTVGVLLVNATNESHYATVPTGPTSEPRDLAVDPPTGWVYVVDLGTSSVSVVSGKAVLASMPVPAIFNTTVIRLNATGGSFDPVYASDIAYDTANGDLYVADTGAGKVSVLNGTRVVTNLSVGRFPYSVTYDPHNAYVYVTNAVSGSVSVISGTSVVGTVTVGKLPTDAVYDAVDGDVLVTNLNSSNVTVLNGTSVVGSIPVGTDPAYAVYDTVNGDAYVVNQGSDNVTVLGAKPAGGASGLPPWFWSIVIVVAVLLILALVVLLTRRRKRRSGTGPPPAPTRGATGSGAPPSANTPSSPPPPGAGR